MAEDRVFMAALGDEVRSWRRKRGMTIPMLAEIAGVGKSTVERLENATHSASVSTTWAIADALDVPLSLLVRRAEEAAEVMREGPIPRPANEGLPGEEREALMAQAFLEGGDDEIATKRSSRQPRYPKVVDEAARDEEN